MFSYINSFCGTLDSHTGIFDFGACLEWDPEAEHRGRRKARLSVVPYVMNGDGDIYTPKKVRKVLHPIKLCV